MQATEAQTKSVKEWESFIGDLTAKARDTDGDVADLVRDRDSLALDAELGIDGAAKKLQKINTELAAKQQAAGSLRTAIAQAQRRLEDARKSETEAAERERKEKIGGHFKRYLAEVCAADDAMRKLAGHFASARAALDAAEGAMTNQERQAVQQLRSLFGPTLAAAHAGLGDHLELGPSASHFVHRQPLEKFVRGFLDFWVKDGD